MKLSSNAYVVHSWKRFKLNRTFYYFLLCFFYISTFFIFWKNTRFVGQTFIIWQTPNAAERSSCGGTSTICVRSLCRGKVFLTEFTSAAANLKTVCRSSLPLSNTPPRIKNNVEIIIYLRHSNLLPDQPIAAKIYFGYNSVSNKYCLWLYIVLHFFSPSLYVVDYFIIPLKKKQDVFFFFGKLLIIFHFYYILIKGVTIVVSAV